MLLLSTVAMDDVKLVVANSIENVVALLGLKVFSFQSLLFPLLAPWQDPEHSVNCQCSGSALVLPQPK